jgi:hypothetical protein
MQPTEASAAAGPGATEAGKPAEFRGGTESATMADMEDSISAELMRCRGRGGDDGTVGSIQYMIGKQKKIIGRATGGEKE